MAETVRPSDVLVGDIDARARVAEVPESYVVKGMFFSRLKARLDDDAWAQVAPELARAPRWGHYVPFRDYPQADYLLLSIRVAERAYANVSLREGLRRIARDDFDVFAASTFGRIVLTTVRDVHAALLSMAETYAKLAPGNWEILGEELDDHTVVISWNPNYGSWEYQLGQIEGLIRYFGGSYEVRFSEPEPRHFRFEVWHE